MWLTDLSKTQEGDICFYVAHGSLLDAAIVLRTGSETVHVAVVSEQGRTIAATSAGITEQAQGHEDAIWRPAGGYDPLRLMAGMEYLEGEVGKPYGYADLANQVLLLAGKDALLLDKSEDCSDLACKFLWIAGVPLPSALIRTNTVTPGGLRHALDALD